MGGTQPLCRAGQDTHGRCADANTSNGKKNVIYNDKIQHVNFGGKKAPFFHNKQCSFELFTCLDLVLEW